MHARAMISRAASTSARVGPHTASTGARRRPFVMTSARWSSFGTRARVAVDPFAETPPPREDLPKDDWSTSVEIAGGKRSAALRGERLEVRPFGQENVGAVAKLLLESGMQGFPTERRTLEVYLSNAVGAYPWGFYLIGTLGDEVVATVGVSFNGETRRKFSTLEPPQDSGYLSDLTVTVDKRGMGLGLAMLRGAEEFARAMKIEEMWLHVALKKPGVIALYRDHGYGVGGIDPGLLGWRGRLLMKRKL